MTRNPFGIHYIPVHQGEHHYRFVQECEPGVVVLVSGNGAPDVQMMAEMYARAPEAEHSYRIHPMSEEHDALWHDPTVTAVHHVSTWQSELRNRYDEAAHRGLRLPPREQIRTQGICEPVIELFARAEDMSNYGEWLAMMRIRTPLLDDYMATYVWESKKYSLPCAVGIFSRGQPANLRPGDYATYDWFPKTRKAVEANPGFAVVAVHEYNSLAGPAADRDWYTYRWMHADWNCRFDVYEYGVWDNGYGWLNRISAADYAAQTVEYIRHCRTDNRFGCSANFTLDGARDWESWYIESAMPEFAMASQLLRTQPGEAPNTPPTVYIPTLPNDGSAPPTAQPSQPQSSGIIDPAALDAILEVESNGSGFIDQRMVIRFEAHIFVREHGSTPHFRYNDAGRPWLEQFWRPTPAFAWRAIHTGHQDSEWAAFEFARSLNETAAMRSISMGAPQIMGFNHQRIGYATPQAMFSAFDDSYPAQLIGLINFILSDAVLVDAIRQRDWRAVAKLYNGPGQVEVYAARMEKAYREASA
mgnify:FL=1